MNKIVKVLLWSSVILSLLCCVIFKSLFVYLNVIIFFLILFVTSRKKSIVYHKLSVAIPAVWFIICDLLALGLKLIVNINLFDSVNNEYILYFIYGGLIIIILLFDYLLKKYNQKGTKSHEKS